MWPVIIIPGIIGVLWCAIILIRKIGWTPETQTVTAGRFGKIPGDLFTLLCFFWGCVWVISYKNILNNLPRLKDALVFYGLFLLILIWLLSIINTYSLGNSGCTAVGTLKTAGKALADGKLLWRVFENLLDNICKYTQEGTRVYLSTEKDKNAAEVTFKNISEYPLDITEEELMERFVRGDKSRHTEGNGLGLNIAKSLVELQKGTMKIVIDGDLFKVILRFPTIE